MVANVVSSIDEEEKKKEAAQKPVYDRMQKQLAADQDRVDQMAADYTPLKQDPQPKPPANDPLSAFASPAGVFAMIASAFTHTPAIAAMNGMAGAINGAKQNNWDAYEAGYKAWKDNTEIAIKNHELQASDMKAAMEKMQTDLTTGVAMAKAVAAQSEDRIATKLLEEGQYQKLDETMRARASAAASMQEASLRIEQLHDQLMEEKPRLLAAKALSDAMQSGDPAKIQAAQQLAAVASGKTQSGSSPQSAALQRYMQEYPNATAEDMQKFIAGFKPQTPANSKEADADALALDAFKKANGRDPAPGDEAEMARLRQTSRADVAGVMSDEDTKLAAQVALKTGHPPASLGRSQANISKFFKAYGDEAKAQGLDAGGIAANQAKFAGELSESRSLGTFSSRVDFGARELDAALPQALELSDKVYRPGFKKAAEIQQALQGQTSDPDLLEFAQQNQAVMSAYAQIMARGGASTVSAMDRAEKMLSTATSQQGYMRQLDRLHKEVQTMLYGSASAKQGLLNQITGGSTETPLPKLTGVSGTTAASSVPQLPPDVAARAGLKEGEVTEFANGQKWTLRNGVPTQVP